MKKKSVVAAFLLAAVILAVIVTYFISQSGSVSAPRQSSKLSELLTVRFIDVGQADSELISLPDGQIMMIDAGNNGDAEMLVKYIQNLGISKIDYLIGTHPHEDHIGSLDAVIDNFEIGKLYLPRATTNTKTFESVLDAAARKNLTIDTAKSGVNIYSDPETSIDIIAPVGTGYSSLNNYSAVVMLRWRDSSFLFTGDAEEESENEITADVSCDVLKVGHHGSSTSSSTGFLRRVNPSFAVISCGEGNSYGHPHEETLEKLESLGVKLYRTDLNGTVTCRTDGTKYYWECEKE